MLPCLEAARKYCSLEPVEPGWPEATRDIACQVLLMQMSEGLVFTVLQLVCITGLVLVAGMLRFAYGKQCRYMRIRWSSIWTVPGSSPVLSLDASAKFTIKVDQLQKLHEQAGLSVADKRIRCRRDLHWLVCAQIGSHLSYFEAHMLVDDATSGTPDNDIHGVLCFLQKRFC